MKYSEKIYAGALAALEKLRQSVTESEKHTIDFIAEAVAEKGDRDHPRTNGDRFRAMTNEELAVTLLCPNDMGLEYIPCDLGDDKDCCACLLTWLNTPEEGTKWND